MDLIVSVLSSLIYFIFLISTCKKNEEFRRRVIAGEIFSL